MTTDGAMPSASRAAIPAAGAAMPRSQPAEAALLAAAFQQFNEHTERLRVAHETLERRVAEVDAQLEQRNRELASANTQLESKIQELDELQHFLGAVINSMNSGLISV